MSYSDGVALAAPAAGKAVLRKLKPGPGLSREAVAMDQKLRLRLALSGLTAESGYDALTVRSLIRRANVSTSTFYNHYESVEDCLASLVGMTVRGVVEEIGQQLKLSGDPLGGLRTALHHLMIRLAQEPEMAQTVFIEAYAAGPRVLNEMNAAVADLATVITESLEIAPRPAAGTTHLAVGLVAGVVGIIRKTTLTGRARDLPNFADELTDWLLSIAHEEVVAISRPRSAEGIDGGALQWNGAREVPRGPIADAGHRAIMTTARIAATGGLAGLTTARIRKEAGLSRREFERHFTGVEECFLDAVESVSAMAADAARLAAANAKNWERWVHIVMTVLCSLAASVQDLSRLVLLDVTSPGRIGLLRREEMISRAATVVREQAPEDKRPSELDVAASISAIWGIAETEVAAGRSVELPRIAPVFVYMILASRRPRVRSRTVRAPESQGARGPSELPTVGRPC